MLKLDRFAYCLQVDSVSRLPHARRHGRSAMTTYAANDPREPSVEPECECQDTDRCPVHHGYD
jgi:hypothetical protein